MSIKKVIAMRLSGMLQSWGFNSEYTHRNSGLFPTKSGMLGMCCAAKGLERGSEGEKQFLSQVSDSVMTAIALPRYQSNQRKTWPILVRRIEDFHTVENTRTATGKANSNAVMTYRQYLCDADFLVLLELRSSVAEVLKDDLQDPKWGFWLGRKSCIPSAPVFAGLFSSLEEVSNKLLNDQSLEQFTYQQDVDSFIEGSDSLSDMPISFSEENRVMNQRRIRIHESVKV